MIFMPLMTDPHFTKQQYSAHGYWQDDTDYTLVNHGEIDILAEINTPIYIGMRHFTIKTVKYTNTSYGSYAD